jgi:ribosomal protein S18 acetylase RimI-like enzyme
MIAGVQRAEILAEISEHIDRYRFDQYLRYPSKNRDGWKSFLNDRIRAYLLHPEQKIFCRELHDGMALVGSRLLSWDEQHFGLKVATVNLVLNPHGSSDDNQMLNLMEECLEDLKKQKVEFVSVRVDGDDIPTIHACESLGFRYIENLIFPVLDTSGFDKALSSNIRHAKKSDLDRLSSIASRNQFRNGRFYIDGRFDEDRVDEMYSKWIYNSFSEGKMIVVCEISGELAGYFIYVIDSALSEKFGFKYGRMTSLCIDEQFRGQGVGSTIFENTVRAMANSGCHYVASEYASRNHTSAFLHAKFGFRSVHDKVLFHLWMK